MSHRQTWSLSQDANKSSGACSTCYAVRQLHLKDGTVHLHGPRNNPCSGSRKPPLNQANTLSSSQTSQSSAPHLSPPVIASTSSPSTSPTFSHPSVDGPIIKHIPKSARSACCTSLSKLLNSISQTSDNLDAWTELLNFGRDVLSKPKRGGKRQNLTSIIKKRLNPNSDPVPETLSSNSRKTKDESASLAAAVSAKIEDGNVKAAIRLICSEDKPAADTDVTYAKLLEKHPAAFISSIQLPDPGTTASLQVSEEEVLKAIRSFPAGSSGGPDGIRPQHIVDLVNCSESGSTLLSAITTFTNSLLAGKCHHAVTPILFGGTLIALEKKSGGIRPIAIGYTWRRIAAKCANSFACARMKDILSPLQLGVAVSGGCEAAVHATRRFAESMPPGHTIIKLDFANAFNSVHRVAMLESAAKLTPEIYRFCHLTYSNPSFLKFGSRSILSQEGAQQGDPLGPLLFCMTIQPMLSSLSSELVIGYLDDITLGGAESEVEKDFQEVRIQGEAVGLKLNVSKCEHISHHGSSTAASFEHFIHLQPKDAILLGAPLSTGAAMDTALKDRCNDLARIVERLKLLTAHDALVLLRCSFSAPRVLHTLRSSPCAHHPALDIFDQLLRTGITAITNLNLSDGQWKQANLPVRDGGLGIRRAASLAPSAFLASAASTRDLQELILVRCEASSDSSVDTMRSWWESEHSLACPSHPASVKQASWDSPSIIADKDSLLTDAADNHHRARILATAAVHSGDWLHALPISSCGLRLDNETIRIAIGLRLGVNLCQPHPCPCGTLVDARGTHGLSCRRSAGRMARHHHLNDLIWRSLTRASIPSIKEPSGLSRTDGKRPDGLTLIPWQAGKSLVWDVTIADTLAASHLPTTSISSSGAADAAAEMKEQKYEALKTSYKFIPVACETMGPINAKALDFISDLGKRITAVTGDPRETTFLFQRISIAIQRFNSVCFQGTFIPPSDPDD